MAPKKKPMKPPAALFRKKQQMKETTDSEPVDDKRADGNDCIEDIKSVASCMHLVSLVNTHQSLSLNPWEIQLPPSLMRKLGCIGGSLVKMCHCDADDNDDENDVISVLEVIMGGSSCGSQCAVSRETLAVHREKEYFIGRWKDGHIEDAETVMLEAPRTGEGNASRVDNVQFSASVVRVLQGKVIFSGMNGSVHIAGHKTRFTVTNVLPRKIGRMTLGTFALVNDIVDVKVACTEKGQVDKLPLSSSRRQHTMYYGESGTGKSYILQKIHAARRDDGRSIIEFDVSRMSNSSEIVNAAGEVRAVFREAQLCAPCTVIVDDINLLVSRGSQASGDQEAWTHNMITMTLNSCLDDIDERGIDVEVVASSLTLDELPKSMLIPPRFYKREEVAQCASAEERFTVLCAACEAAFTTEQYKGITVDVLREIAENSHGFLQRDLAQIPQHALVNAFRTKSSTQVIDDDLLRHAAKSITPSAIRNFEVVIPKVRWSDIGGSDEAKKTLQECVDWCLGRQRWVFEKFNISPPKGVLLYGPPGCSKTMLAKALANESKMNFISVKGPEVFSKWVGDSEKAIRDIFSKARAVAPCVVFIDELDGMCGHRGKGGVSDRVISQFLTELDGLPAALSGKTDSIVLVAATNRPNDIDSAVLRPGRIDRKVYVGLPEEVERRAIAEISFRNVPCSEKVTSDRIAASTVHYTGAEVVAVCKECSFHAISRGMDAQRIEECDLEAALRKVRPRVSSEDVAWYKNWAAGIR